VTQSLTAAQRKNPTALHMLAGGEAAMWSDEYCPAPLCAINGTYGWMAGKFVFLASDVLT
jgi:hypothetical protein